MSTTTTDIPTKAQILALLSAHVAQRSGIDFRDYDGPAAFMGDYRDILRHGRDARALLRAAEHCAVSAEQLMVHLGPGGRLAISRDAKGRWRVDYTTGQYFAVEYRAAACRAISGALWAFVRESRPELDGDGRRAHFKKWFGRGIAARWFN